MNFWAGDQRRLPAAPEPGAGRGQGPALAVAHRGRGRVSPAARSPRLVPALARDSGLGCTHRRGDWRGADGPQVPAGGLYWRGPGHGIRPPRR